MFPAECKLNASLLVLSRMFDCFPENASIFVTTQGKTVAHRSSRLSSISFEERHDQVSFLFYISFISQNKITWRFLSCEAVFHLFNAAFWMTRPVVPSTARRKSMTLFGWSRLNFVSAHKAKHRRALFGKDLACYRQICPQIGGRITEKRRRQNRYQGLLVCLDCKCQISSANVWNCTQKRGRFRDMVSHSERIWRAASAVQKFTAHGYHILFSVCKRSFNCFFAMNR